MPKTHGEFDYIFARASVPDAAVATSRQVREQLRDKRKSLVRSGLAVVAAGVLSLVGVSSAQAQVNPYQAQNAFNTIMNVAGGMRGNNGGTIISNMRQGPQSDYGYNGGTIISNMGQGPQANYGYNGGTIISNMRPGPSLGDAVGSVISNMQQGPQAQYGAHDDGYALGQATLRHVAEDPSLGYSGEQISRATIYHNGVIRIPDRDGIQTLFTMDAGHNLLQMPYDPALPMKTQTYEMAKLRQMDPSQREAYYTRLDLEREQADALQPVVPTRQVAVSPPRVVPNPPVAVAPAEHAPIAPTMNAVPAAPQSAPPVTAPQSAPPVTAPQSAPPVTPPQSAPPVIPPAVLPVPNTTLTIPSLALVMPHETESPDLN